MTTIHRDRLRVSLRLWRVSLRLLIVATFLTVLGVAIVAEYTQDASYSDGAVCIRVAEVEADDTDKDVTLQPLAVLAYLPINSFVIIPKLHFSTLQYVDIFQHCAALRQRLHLRGPPI